jgi:D-alanine-D-alanine ligase
MTAIIKPSKLRIALVFGGRSEEHEVSVVSARSVDRALDREKYEVVPMAIDRMGLWADAATAQRALAEAPQRTDSVAGFKGRHRLDPRLLEADLDVVFPVLHGPFGEDGTIQGLFEMIDLPFVGCDTASSAVCMDKIFCKRMLAQAGVPTPAWEEIDHTRWAKDRNGVVERCLGLGLPLFAKPARLGSSVGISKVHEDGDLEAAIDLALGHGERVVVEKGLQAREIEVAVLGNRQPRAAVPGEVVPGHEFYDYKDKYVDSACEILAPAPLDSEAAAAAQQLAVEVFRLLGCSGMARVDLFLDHNDGGLWVNEVNTIPGFTSISLFPRLWGLSGLDCPALVDELVRLAFSRSAKR